LRALTDTQWIKAKLDIDERQLPDLFKALRDHWKEISDAFQTVSMRNYSPKVVDIPLTQSQKIFAGNKQTER
jgi:hypothetical protein